MDMIILATVFESTVFLIILIAVGFWLWPCVRLDSFRQNMFGLRDELFDYAASGRIAFDHPAYRLLRQSMNGFIRHAHRLTFFQVVMNTLAWKVEGRAAPTFDWTARWNVALASIKNRDVMADLIKFHERETMLVSERVVLGSPFLIAVLTVGFICALFHLGWTSLRSAFNTAVATTTARIIDPRLLDEEAARASA
jgi:hypothetical protein